LEQREQLNRIIGIQGLAAGVINFIVGAGIFALPALVAVILGFSSIYAYLMCGGLILMIMLCFAEVGSKITVSGGPYAYIQAAFGPYAGFLSNHLFWFGYCVLADAAIANAMVDMLSIPFPIFSKGLVKALFLFVVFGGFTFINIRGVKQGIIMVKTLTLIKLIPLLFLVLAGIFWIDPENLTLGAFPSASSLGEASILLFFAFGGGEGALSSSGEIKSPEKTIPRGLLLGIVSVVLLYIGIQVVCQGILGETLVNYTEAPLAETASRIIGATGLSLFLIAAIFSIFSLLSGSIMQYPRILYSGARDGSTPKYLAQVHPKYHTPIWAIVTYAAMDFIFSISGGFEQLAVISSAALLLIYLGVVLSAMKIKLTDKNKKINGFTLPGGISIHVIASITIFWFLIQLSIKEWISVFIFLLGLSIIYFLKNRIRKPLI
jgi:amino acid transporter